MEFNRQKYEYFFPRKVYRCACLGEVVQKSLHNGDYSLVDIVDRQFVCTENENSQNATVKYADGKKETYCKGCIKHYLKLMFHYFYFVDFE